MLRCAVTGVGALCSLGVGVDTVWTGLINGQPHVGEVRTEVEGHAWRRFAAHPIPPLDVAAELGADRLRYLDETGLSPDRDFLYLAIAIQRAISDARLASSDLNRAALIVGHENPGVGRLIDELWASFFTPHLTTTPIPTAAEALFRKHQRAFFHVQSFGYLFHLAKMFDLHGHTMVLNNACASGLYAVEAAAQLIDAGLADTVIVAASDRATQITKFLWFSDQGMYSPSGRLRPFDRYRDGIVLGEAGAAMVLERGTAARARGATPYGSYAGGGFAQETWRITLPDVSSSAYVEAIRQGLTRAEVSPGEVDVIVAHGTGSGLADRYEAAALARAFGGRLPPVTAFKGAVGHTLGCSALLESTFALCMLRDGVIPRTVNFEHADPAISLPIVARTEHRPVRTILRTANAFGGFDAAAVFIRDAETSTTGGRSRGGDRR